MVERFLKTGGKQKKANEEMLAAAAKALGHELEYAWPGKGPSDQIRSLETHAIIRSIRPSAVYVLKPKEVAQAFWESTNSHKLRVSEPDSLKDLISVINHVIDHELVKTSSPGAPLCADYPTNESWMTEPSIRQMIVDTVVYRIDAYARVKDEDLKDPLQNWQNCLLDFVRVFIKAEPHSLKKIQQKRYRLIACVSVVMQIISRILHGEQHRWAVNNWRTNAAKCGFGVHSASVDEWNSIKAHIRMMDNPKDSDQKCYDWHVSEFDYECLLEYRNMIYDCSDEWRRVIRTELLLNSHHVFMAGNGHAWMVLTPGIQLSGKFLTTEGNSDMRAMEAYHAHYMCFGYFPAVEPIVMGDDSIEDWPGTREQMVATYKLLGKKLVSEERTDGKLEWCSAAITPVNDEPVVYLNQDKALYRLIHQSPTAIPEVSQQVQHLFSHETWEKVKPLVDKIASASEERK